jgi:hypothetical protein
MPSKVYCQSCDQPFDLRRKQLGYNFCLDCGEYHATKYHAGWTIAPIAHEQGTTPDHHNHEITHIIAAHKFVSRSTDNTGEEL